MRLIVRSLFIVLCLTLAACASRPRAVVLERSSDPSVSRSVRTNAGGRHREYLVVGGDTLYGIAFRHDVDFRELARWNGIDAPYTIFPGQRLRLNARSATTRVAAREPASRPPANPRAPGAASPRQPMPIAAAPLPPPRAPAQTAPIVSPPAASEPLAQGPLATQGVVWRWPASGQLVSRYVSGDPTRQGVNIAGNAGQPVFAAAGGEVVYSGAGLIGYGELVIVKHSDVFLSAYGHNRKRLVSEGQRVSAGQQIAEMGRSGASRDMLHFEIRRSGKPIDPLPLLPKR